MKPDCGAARRLLLDTSAPREVDAPLERARLHAGTCPDCAAFVAGARATAALVKASVAEEAPGELRDKLFETIAEARAGRTYARRRFGVVVAAAAVGAIVLIGAERIVELRQTRAAVASLASDHAIAVADDRIESGDRTLIEEWIVRRVGYAVRVPSLGGGRVVGARTCITPLGRGAVIEYEIDGRRVSYFIIEGGVESPPGRVSVAESKGFSIAHWRDAGLTHAFVAALPGDRVEALAHECIEQFRPRRGPTARRGQSVTST